jgi:uncharacterized protein (TIGR02452 family)
MTRFLNKLPSNFSLLKANTQEVIATLGGAKYKLAGKFLVTPRKKEQHLLRFKACVLAFFTLGIACAWEKVRMGLKGKKIEKVYLAVNATETTRMTDRQATGPTSPLKTEKPLQTILPAKVDAPKQEKSANPPVPYSGEYPKNAEETDHQFRARIYLDTKAAIKNGYVNAQGKVVKLESNYWVKTLAQLPKGETPPNFYPTHFEVITDDTLNVMLKLQEEGKNPVGINMANRHHPGGGVDEGCPAQEEALSRRSNMAQALATQNYPFGEFGSILTQNVELFRTDKYLFMDKPERVHLAAVAIYDLREKSSDRDKLGLPSTGEITLERLKRHTTYKENTKAILRQMLRTMGPYMDLVLGAIGCGAFQNPPDLIAALFEEVFAEPEFFGRFRSVTFAILDIFPNDKLNIAAFTELSKKLNASHQNIKNTSDALINAILDGTLKPENLTDEQVKALDLTKKENADRLGDKLREIFYHFIPVPYSFKERLELLPPEAVNHVLNHIKYTSPKSYLAWYELREAHIKAVNISLLKPTEFQNLLKTDWGAATSLTERRNEIAKVRWLTDEQVIQAFNNKLFDFKTSPLCTDEQIKRLDFSRLTKEACEAARLATIFEDRPQLLREVFPKLEQHVKDKLPKEIWESLVRLSKVGI